MKASDISERPLKYCCYNASMIGFGLRAEILDTS